MTLKLGVCETGSSSGSLIKGVRLQIIRRSGQPTPIRCRVVFVLRGDGMCGAVVLWRATVCAANENVCSVGMARNPSQLSEDTKAKERIMQIAKWSARIGAVFYVLWGVFHLVAANTVYILAEQSTGMVRGRLLQNAFYVLFLALAGISMAIILNWRNDKQGYWMNGTLIAVADIPFVLFVLVPGLVPWWPGLAGPLLWLLAFVFTSVGRFSAHPSAAFGAPA
jgi:hypothetical protein